MADVFTKTKRSLVMSQIRGSGNRGTELALVSFFHMLRITGWRRHLSISPGAADREKKHGYSRRFTGKRFRVRPDFVFPKNKVAVFVDGCFWHGCPKHFTQPKGNSSFWRKKLSGNKARDRLVDRMLRKIGWRVVRIWEHELKMKNRHRLAKRFVTLRIPTA